MSKIINAFEIGDLSVIFYRGNAIPGIRATASRVSRHLHRRGTERVVDERQPVSQITPDGIERRGLVDSGRGQAHCVRSRLNHVEGTDVGVQPGDSEDRALVLGPDAVQRGRVVEQRRLAWTAHYRSHTAAYGCQISRILREIPHFRPLLPPPGGSRR